MTFSLLSNMRLRATDILPPVLGRYACRLEQSQIVHLFERHCLDAFDNSGQYKPDYLGNYPIAENSMMQVNNCTPSLPMTFVTGLVSFCL